MEIVLSVCYNTLYLHGFNNNTVTELFKDMNELDYKWNTFQINVNITFTFNIKINLINSKSFM